MKEKTFLEKSGKISKVKLFKSIYIGLLLLADIYKSYEEPTKSLWDKEIGRNIFRATMSLETFCTMSRVIRFDNKSTCQERRKLDKLAVVRDILEKWIEILPKLYNLNLNITVEEQLGFRDRCPFKQYVPSKPSKYGTKIIYETMKLRVCTENTNLHWKRTRVKDEENSRNVSSLCDLNYGWMLGAQYYM
ncbi:uncharacterized protein TNCT_42171 [Trichonephila clavata]|uniref:PiggyBac transposable element-derived protein domain-containing protein n=1 Tax=Trichonephila clavata TaxID=2740835 RepID=A0A8X6LRS5_TRICU|nr:uncharacterized protein TNCT_42171 [Trichonephila clavata]